MWRSPLRLSTREAEGRGSTGRGLRVLFPWSEDGRNLRQHPREAENGGVVATGQPDVVIGIQTDRRGQCPGVGRGHNLIGRGGEEPGSFGMKPVGQSQRLDRLQQPAQPLAREPRRAE